MGSTSKFDSNAVFIASVEDAFEICARRRSARFVGFLDEAQHAAAFSVASRNRSVAAVFSGGYDGAERMMLGVFPDEEDVDFGVFPISAMAFFYRSSVQLNHRDFLGTILSCGVKRAVVGDILCGEGISVAFVDSGMAEFLAGQITKVGGEGVRITVGYDGELPVANLTEEIHDTVASMRIDCVIAAAAGVSRESAATLIKSARVSINHRECLSVSQMTGEGDILSVRGTGRFRISRVGPFSRKGRLFITIEKYI